MATIVGTTNPIFVQGNLPAAIAKPGEDYFLVQMVGAQIAFTGSIWNQVKGLIIASEIKVETTRDNGVSGLRAIHASRKVERGRTEKLGLKPILIDLVPATMTNVSISIDFVLDQQGRLDSVAGLINDASFIAAFSLSPAAAAVAKSTGVIAKKILEAFVPSQAQKPLLKFSGDWALSGGEVQQGYHVILGSAEGDRPLPDPRSIISYSEGTVLVDGNSVQDVSYVVLRVIVVPARTRAQSGGAIWEEKLREAEDVVTMLETPEERQSAWTKARGLLREAQTLLRADPNYLTSEARDIVAVSYRQCQSAIEQKEFASERSGDSGTVRGFAINPGDVDAVDLHPQDVSSASYIRYMDQTVTASDGLKLIEEARSAEAVARTNPV